MDRISSKSDFEIYRSTERPLVLTVVYNRKRHGRFAPDGRTNDLRIRACVPPPLTEEVLMIDLFRNFDRVAEKLASVACG